MRAFILKNSIGRCGLRSLVTQVLLCVTMLLAASLAQASENATDGSTTQVDACAGDRACIERAAQEFAAHFPACEPTTMLRTMAHGAWEGVSMHYAIIGPREDGCALTLTFRNIPEQPPGAASRGPTPLPSWDREPLHFVLDPAQPFEQQMKRAMRTCLTASADDEMYRKFQCGGPLAAVLEAERKQKNAAVSAEATAEEDVTCNTQDCFAERVTHCRKAVYDARSPLGQARYQVEETEAAACRVSLTYLDNPNPDWVGKPLAFLLDPAKPVSTQLKAAVQACLTGTGQEDWHCQGPLMDVIGQAATAD